VDDAIPAGGVDVLLMCISGRHATDGFVPRLLRRVEPRIVMPMHYDNFFRRADAKMTLLPLTRFGRLVDEVHAFDRQAEVATLPVNGSFSIAF
jgi:L-ascorbate metabolism protein UlaG (beta-lactamase superfamily)